MNKYTFFWGGIFSQWARFDMSIDGITFNCCEQYMMYSKAKFFGDEETAKEIMKSTNPAEQKRLGRKVKNFNTELWNKVCFSIVYKANYAKFSQNPTLKEGLLATEDRILVEASPEDRIWGIGMGVENTGISDPANWQGSNLLGFALTLVKQELKYVKPVGKHESKFEVCTRCGTRTPYLITDDINLRFWYVEGAGQLCERCHTEIYKDE